ncbi:unnamed protein product, partial [Cladocopium goreaui]
WVLSAEVLNILLGHSAVGMRQRWSLLSLSIFGLVLHLSLRASFVPCRYLRAAPIPRVRRHAQDLDGRNVKKEYTVNEEIRANEVRVVGIASGERGQMQETNQIMSISGALDMARELGVDVILINEDQDPPLVKIASVGKYIYQENKKKKEQAKNKQPKMKEVKISYTIGDHDLYTRLTQIEKWVENPRQQVKVQVVLKGRSRMFEKQARQLLDRVRREVAAYAKVPGIDKGNDPVTKDGRGDLIMLLGQGPDRALLKQIIEEAGGKKAVQKGALEEEEVEEEEEEEEEAPADEDDEVKAIEAEMKEMREELIECGISPGQVNQEPEMQDLLKRLNAAKAKVGA